MSHSILEFFSLPRPTFDTIADTIADLAGRKIFHNGRRDCTAERLRQDRYVHSGVWPVPSDNRRGGDGIESRKETDRSRSIRTAETVAGVVDAGPAVSDHGYNNPRIRRSSKIRLLFPQWRTSPPN